MKFGLDSFKVIVVVSMLLCLASLAFISYVAVDAIQGAKIPNQEYGLVTSKSPVNDNPIANYKVVISSGKTLYIPNNTTLYDSIQVNQEYLFSGRIDFNNQMILIDMATQPFNTTTP